MTHDQFERMIRQANPVPDVTALEPDDASDLFDHKRRAAMQTNDLITVDREPESRRRGHFIGVAATVAVVTTALLVFQTSDVARLADRPVAQAEAYWEAVAAGDLPAVLELIDPAANSQGVVPFGRAHSMEGQFDWYRAVGWQWEPGGCVQRVENQVECTVTAKNAWSEVLEVEPITATFIMWIGEDGIILVTEELGSFSSQWLPQVFDVFLRWVLSNSPADAMVMFDFAVDVDPEIIGLYEVNTNRFVEAHRGD